MKVLLDACVLYPTVLRAILLGVAKSGAFQPIWSERILEEWARATRKLGEEGEIQARGEIAILKSDWPMASVEPRAGDLARLWLPDENDIHVLAAAIAASADTIVTFNIRDFPKRILDEEGVARISPDPFLLDIWQADPALLESVVASVKERAERETGESWDTRSFLKRAQLPRLGKALVA